MKIQMKKVFNLRTNEHHYESKFSLTKSENDIAVILCVKDLSLCTMQTIRNIIKDEDLPEYWVRLAYPEELSYAEVREQFSLSNSVFSTEHIKLRHLYNNKKEYFFTIIGTPDVLRVYQVTFKPNKNTKHIYWQNEIMYNVINLSNMKKIEEQHDSHENTHENTHDKFYDNTVEDNLVKDKCLSNNFGVQI